MIKHTFVNKCNTIFKNSKYNTGLNPVAELNVGDSISRILLDFNLKELKNNVINKEIDINNLTHKIKMVNCGSVNLPLYDEMLSIAGKDKKRASSFDIIAFKLPFEWDNGRGFDYISDNSPNTLLSTDGSTWFQCRNHVEWDENGVYTNDTLLNDYNDNFLLKKDGIIIGEQHFDFGTENLDIDVTNYMNKVLLGEEKFYGIGLAFSPVYESNTNENRFITFFTPYTNTFFLPYLETINSSYVIDDRANFHIGVNNRLYLYVNDSGEAINLDKLPSCTINDTKYDVKQNGKGAYYIDVLFKNGDIEPNTILYDIWSDIYLNEQKLDDIEMEFVVLPMKNRISIGNNKGYTTPNIVPQVSGINNKESLKIGNIYELIVDFIEEFSYGKKIIPLKSYYRLYVKENNREIDVFEYQPLIRKFDEHSIIINTNELIPNDYYLDIQIKQGNNVKVFNNVLEFSVINNVTNYKI